jgi:oligopeptide transport system ATP-binding protein
MSELNKQANKPNDDNVLLRVENLSQHFGDLKAVDNISFDIKKGEVFGLVGESGCGKTTTGRSIIKLYNITSGSIYFKGKRIGAGTLSYKNAIKDAKKKYKEDIDALNNGNDPDKNEKAAKLKEDLKHFIAEQKKQIASAKYDNSHVDKDLITQIQMIFQDPIASLDPRMTVREIISEGLVIKGVKDRKEIDEKVYQVLETVGLVREHAGRYPHEFSGGQRQRIGVARSVIMRPELIIADEPVSALDVSIQAQVINLLNDLRHDLGITILFVAHDLSVVKYFSDRIGVMYFGKMVELADSDELFRHPLHPYTRSLLSAIPLPDPDYEKNRKRLTYVPLRDHDYSVEQPTFREVSPNHFVLCSDSEEAKYKEIIGG